MLTLTRMWGDLWCWIGVGRQHQYELIFYKSIHTDIEIDIDRCVYTFMYFLISPTEVYK